MADSGNSDKAIVSELKRIYDSGDASLVVKMCDNYFKNQLFNSAELKVLKARALDKLGKNEPSFNVCCDVLSMNDVDLDTLIDCGMILHNLGYLDDCSDMVKKVYELHGESCSDNKAFSSLARMTDNADILLEIENGRLSQDKSPTRQQCENFAALVLLSGLFGAEGGASPKFLNEAENFLGQYMETYKTSKLYDLTFLYAEILRMSGKHNCCMSLIENYMSHCVHIPMIGTGEYMFEAKKMLSGSAEQINNILDIFLRTKKCVYLKEYISKVLDVYKHELDKEIVYKALKDLDDVLNTTSKNVRYMVTLKWLELALKAASMFREANNGPSIPALEMDKVTPSLVDSRHSRLMAELFNRIDDSCLYTYFRSCFNCMDLHDLTYFRSEFLHKYSQIDKDFRNEESFHRTINLKKIYFALNCAPFPENVPTIHSEIIEVVGAYSEYLNCITNKAGCSSSDDDNEKGRNRLAILCELSVQFIIYEYSRERNNPDLLLFCAALINTYPHPEKQQQLIVLLVELYAYLSFSEALHTTYSKLPIKNILIDTFGYIFLDSADCFMPPERALNTYKLAKSFYNSSDIVNSDLLDNLFQRSAYIQIKLVHKAIQMFKYSIQRYHTQAQITRSKVLLAASLKVCLIQYLSKNIRRRRHTPGFRHRTSDNRVRSSSDCPVLGHDLSLESLLYGEQYPILRNSEWLEFYEIFPATIIKVYNILFSKDMPENVENALEHAKIEISELKRSLESQEFPAFTDNCVLSKGHQSTHPIIFKYMAMPVCTAGVLYIDTVFAFLSRKNVANQDGEAILSNVMNDVTKLSGLILTFSIEGSGDINPNWRTRLCISHAMELIAFLRLIFSILQDKRKQLKPDLEEFEVGFTEACELFRRILVNSISELIQKVLQLLGESESSCPPADNACNVPFYSGICPLTSKLLDVLDAHSVAHSYHQLRNAVRDDINQMKSHVLSFLMFNYTCSLQSP